MTIGSRVCPECGTPIPSYRDTCPECGRDITGQTLIMSQRKAEKLIDDLMEGIDEFRDIGQYGGIPGHGGIKKRHNGYLIGLSNTFEALHCILGSVVRISGYDDWKRGLGAEKEHIGEEMEKINRFVDEYSRDMYLTPPHEGGEWREGDKALPYLRRKTEDLPEIATKNKGRTKRLDMPQPIKDLAIQTFETVRVMSLKVHKSTRGRYNIPSENVFKDEEVINEIETLRDEVKRVLKI